MVKKEVLRCLLDHKKISILKVLYFAQEEMYLREIAKKSEVSVSSVFRILGALKGSGLVRSKEIGTMKFYGLVRSGKSKFLDDWFKEESLLDLFLEEVKGLKGLKRVLLHGKLEKNRVSLILIGEGVDELRVDKIGEEVKDKGFDLSYVILNENQFVKLDKMGVYGGEKKVLMSNIYK